MSNILVIMIVIEYLPFCLFILCYLEFSLYNQILLVRYHNWYFQYNFALENYCKLFIGLLILICCYGIGDIVWQFINDVIVIMIILWNSYRSSTILINMRSCRRCSQWWPRSLIHIHREQRCQTNTSSNLFVVLHYLCVTPRLILHVLSTENFNALNCKMLKE